MQNVGAEGAWWLLEGVLRPEVARGRCERYRFWHGPLDPKTPNHVLICLPW